MAMGFTKRVPEGSGADGSGGVGPGQGLQADHARLRGAHGGLLIIYRWPVLAWLKSVIRSFSGCRTESETDEGWSVSCLDLPGCHSQGETREEALQNIREAIGLWL